MRKKTKLVHGVGVNDADYPVYVQAMICGKNKLLWTCPFYRAWKGMLERCYSKKLHAKRPTYTGCRVVAEWHVFSVFRDWMLTQPWEGHHMDKDILFPGNKIYGPNTCVFVGLSLNSFMTEHDAARGEWPLGVSWHKRKGKFMATCSNPFTRKLETIGQFDDPNTAHYAWRRRKHRHACTYADMQEDPRIAQALRTRYRSKEDCDG